MYTEHDERRGTVKTCWAKVRERVHKVAPEFAALVDDVNPGKDMPLFLAYYSYGRSKGDTSNVILPRMDDGDYRLTKNEAPKEVFKYLGYGSDSAPFTMVLEKTSEMFTDIKDQQVTSPRIVYQPGDFFPLSRFFTTHQRRYSPNAILTGTAGARSVFLLPEIGSLSHHAHLQRDFGIQSAPIKLLHEHHALFKELANHTLVNCDWKSCLLMFSEKFLQSIIKEKKWLPIKDYILQYGWNKTDYDRCQFYYDVIFSTIQRKRNLRPNPFVLDTVKHILKISLGVIPGFSPLTTDDLLPLTILQEIFIESYGLKHTPTIMGPQHYIFEKDKHPTYFSLQYASPDIFAPTSRTSSSTVFEIRELAHVIEVLQQELSRDDSLCADTVFKDLMRTLEFSYYHNRPDQHRVMRLSKELETLDPRFQRMPTKYKTQQAAFASDSKFFRGCVAISNPVFPTPSFVIPAKTGIHLYAPLDTQKIQREE